LDYASLQAAVDAIAKTGGTVEISRFHEVREELTLFSNIQLLGVGGKIVFVGAHPTAHEGDQGPSRVAVNASHVKNVRLIDLDVSDGKPQAGPLVGIRLFDAVDSWIERNRLTKASMAFHSYDARKVRNLRCRDNIIDLDGVDTAGIYVSAQNGAVIDGNSVFAGHEGVGIYNGTQNAVISRNLTLNHRPGDGIIIVDGHDLIISENVSRNNAQSGIATQRFHTPNDVRDVNIISNIVADNAYDGIDSNGGLAEDVPKQSYEVNVVANHSHDNARAGLYLTHANYALLVANRASRNGLAGVYVNNSSHVLASSNITTENAAKEPIPAFRAGLVLYDAPHATSTGNVSANTGADNQLWGLVETSGDKAYNSATITGGDYAENKRGPFNRSFHARPVRRNSH